MRMQEREPDGALLTRARGGEASAFRLLVERYEDQVARTIAGMLGRKEDVDDIAQETFIRFYESLDKFREESSVATYLTRIAINLSLNELKRRRRWSARFFFHDDHTETSVPDPESKDKEYSDLDEHVQRALQSLDSKQRAVVVLRMVDDYSTKETADILGVPVGTVLSRLSRGQEKLGTLLKPYLEDDPQPQQDKRSEQ